jgi:protein-L-isoaspartate(D-aspartate) O-methyltransferase
MTGVAAMQDAAMRDMAEARRRMVDGQLRPNRVTDARLLAAMGDIPRERFLPPALSARAYADEDVRLPGGRGLIAPMVLARLIQSLAIRDGDRILVVGAGTGYAAAVIVRCGGRVVAVEDDPALIAIARRATEGHASPEALRLVTQGVAEGYAAAAPYDGILIEGAVPAVPAAISGQLAEGGRLVAVLAGGVSRAVLGRQAGGSFSVTSLFDCATLALPAFTREPGFVF